MLCLIELKSYLCNLNSRKRELFEINKADVTQLVE